MAKVVPPSITLTSFSCPRCGALAQQFWHDTYCKAMDSKHAPYIPRPDKVEVIIRDLAGSTTVDDDKKQAMATRLRRAATGATFISGKADSVYVQTVENLHLSYCYACHEISIWLYDGLLWPAIDDAPPANPDISADVRRDYDEAASIVSMSPRGAAALLRLVLQKLVDQLGGNGSTLNDAIADLVSRGLDVRIQQSLDLVRVIGNNAVHPGQIDLRDDRDTALKLFALINLIADDMITKPKQIDALYQGLPKSQLEQIEKRDKKKP